MLDASVALAWCFEDEANATSEAVLDGLATERLGAPLATLDAHLARAATSAGVALVSGP